MPKHKETEFMKEANKKKSKAKTPYFGSGGDKSNKRLARIAQAERAKGKI